MLPTGAVVSWVRAQGAGAHLAVGPRSDVAAQPEVAAPAEVPLRAGALGEPGSGVAEPAWAQLHAVPVVVPPLAGLPGGSLLACEEEQHAP